MTTRQPDPAPGAEPERGFVLAAPPKGVDPVLAELRELSRTAGVEPVAELVQHRERPDPRTYVGKGKLEELKTAYKETASEVLLVDDELSPSQQRLLENELQSRVVDRTQLILDIFAQHAVTAEGKLQVELALLGGRKLVVDEQRLGAGLGVGVLQLLELPLADVGARVRACAALDELGDGLDAGRARKLPDLCELLRRIGPLAHHGDDEPTLRIRPWGGIGLAMGHGGILMPERGPPRAGAPLRTSFGRLTGGG